MHLKVSIVIQEKDYFYFNSQIGPRVKVLCGSGPFPLNALYLGPITSSDVRFLKY